MRMMKFYRIVLSQNSHTVYSTCPSPCSFAQNTRKGCYREVICPLLCRRTWIGVVCFRFVRHSITLLCGAVLSTSRSVEPFFKIMSADTITVYAAQGGTFNAVVAGMQRPPNLGAANMFGMLCNAVSSKRYRWIPRPPPRHEEGVGNTAIAVSP